MHMIFRPYRRLNAVLYARHWAYGRNPRFYDYEELGGDCTNFASQCIYAGTGVMNDTPIYGWYYIDPDNKAPAWTGVEYLYNFLTRPQASLGPVAQVTEDLRSAMLGDVILHPAGKAALPASVQQCTDAECGKLCSLAVFQHKLLPLGPQHIHSRKAKQQHSAEDEQRKAHAAPAAALAVYDL